MYTYSCVFVLVKMIVQGFASLFVGPDLGAGDWSVTVAVAGVSSDANYIILLFL